ncbi:hypothetical protein I2I11_08495 [Pontibacter sp. 172403-2]|uniref:hypothetical protein n=1 Tax=Pontibacter rufus TaxID=2791028 RepID=UPI0018B00D16|nr:hypothetical protein [Pontibacter sp. 172403-2]MBF9253328.1 hypothetical protein [Pontibacter sp. 172403-2]
MNKIYHINGRHHVKSISNGLKILPWFPVALAVGYLGGFTSSILDPGFLKVLIIYNSICFLPALLLHVTYYFANRDTKLEIEPGGRSITITNSNGEYCLQIDDIRKVERVIYSDYKLPKWQQNWTPMPWRNYGYLKLITTDDKMFLLTSLLLDPLKPPIHPTVTKYSYIPFLEDRIEKEPTIEELKEYQRVEIEAYKAKFQNHTEEELKKKTIANGFKKEATIAANELLEERKTIANNTYSA